MALTHETTHKSKTKKHFKDKTPDDNLTRYAVTIKKQPHEVYAFFKKFENLPSFMKDLKSVTTRPPKLSHWVVELDSGLQVEWDAETTSDRHAEHIAWKSVESAEVETSGSVHFAKAPQGRGTVVSLAMDYSIPGGKLTELATKLKAEDPDSLALINLRRLKALLETGEIPTTEGQSSGRETESYYTQH